MQRTIKRREAGEAGEWPDTLHPVLRRVFEARKLRSAAELDYSLGRLCPYTSLGNVERAAALLADLIEADKSILIVSDYDADGATACALGLLGLKDMGAARVDYLVPDRFTHGYGLSPAVAELALAREPDAIVTVDNGISSIEGVALARARGVDVIITDHHLPGVVLPAASVIVNPNLAGDAFPSKCIAGVGVMFYVLAALRAALKERGWFERRGIPAPNLAARLDLVALGTVADVVQLDHNNRIMVSYGLSLIRGGRCTPGIRALFEVAGRDLRKVVAGDLGFVAGPRLNAAGRLTDMRLGIECLTGSDEDACRRMAADLDNLNRERRGIQEEMHQQALEELGKLQLSADAVSGVCLYNADWHQGVIGILASRIKDSLHKPVIAFAPDDTGVLKGSARSVTGLHIRDIIDRIATREPDLIVTFGGHAMAAGLTIGSGAFETFAHLFNEEVETQLKLCGTDSGIYSDGELTGREICMETAELIRDAGPWGQGFPEPQFDGIFEVVERRIVGGSHLKLKVKTADGAGGIDAIAFNTTDADWPADTTRLTAVYRLDINEYMGRRTPQLIVEYLTLHQN